jgi:hypothetical protein
MGLFGNGKKKKQFDELMAEMRAPQIPENAPAIYINPYLVG